MRIEMKLPTGTKGPTGWGKRDGVVGQCDKQDLYKSGFNSTLCIEDKIVEIFQKKNIKRELDIIQRIP